MNFWREQASSAAAAALGPNKLRKYTSKPNKPEKGKRKELDVWQWTTAIGTWPA